AVKKYLEHEKEIHEKISELRTKIIQQKKYSTQEIDSLINTENEITNQLFALAENYPDLKGDEVLGNLMEKLRNLENEIALMRHGYNDSVELYKTTTQRLPEVIIAKLFKFKPLDFLKTKISVRKKPELNLN
ncbi:MAG: LemA family protein, partial [Verrucomicrobiota bacterium]|nr:LemA family protein [Verrucomicrobiota bacterium]